MDTDTHGCGLPASSRSTGRRLEQNCMVTFWRNAILVRNRELKADRVTSLIGDQRASLSVHIEVRRPKRLAITPHGESSGNRFRIQPSGVPGVRERECRISLAPKQWIPPIHAHFDKDSVGLGQAILGLLNVPLIKSALRKPNPDR